jgi:hypothetical protein
LVATEEINAPFTVVLVFIVNVALAAELVIDFAAAAANVTPRRVASAYPVISVARATILAAVSVSFGTYTPDDRAINQDVICASAWQ